MSKPTSMSEEPVLRMADGGRGFFELRKMRGQP